MTPEPPKTVLGARFTGDLLNQYRAEAPSRSRKAAMPGRKEERFDTELAVELEGGGKGVARNVSANGIFFVTDAALKAGQPVSFTLEFRDFPSGPIEVNCVARVVRVVEQGAGLGVGAAIETFEFRTLGEAGEGSVT